LDERVNARKQWHLLSIGVVLLGIALTTGSMWAGILDPLIFDASGNERSNGLFPILSPLLLSLSMRLHFGWYHGSWLLLAGLGGMVFTIPENRKMLGHFRERRFSAAALAVTLGAHLMIVAFSIQFFFVPAGESIRPMGWAMFMFRIAAPAFVLGLPLAVVSLVKEKPKIFGALAGVLSCTPFFFSSAFLHLAAAI